jgi:hypothetical protein
MQEFESWSDVPKNFTGKFKFKGVIRYYLNGKHHRTDGPAKEYPNGDKIWYKEGKLHRLDGPAAEWSDRTKEWYVEDKEYTEEVFNALPEVIMHKAGLQMFL